MQPSQPDDTGSTQAWCSQPVRLSSQTPKTGAWCSLAYGVNRQRPEHNGHYDGMRFLPVGRDADDDRIADAAADLIEDLRDRTLSAMTRTLDHVPDAVTRLRATAVRLQEEDVLEVLSGPFAGNPAAAIGALQDAVDAMLGSFGAVRGSLDNAQAALSGATTPAPGRLTGGITRSLGGSAGDAPGSACPSWALTPRSPALPVFPISRPVQRGPRIGPISV